MLSKHHKLKVTIRTYVIEEITSRNIELRMKYSQGEFSIGDDDNLECYIDSISLTEMIVRIEESYGISLPDEDVESYTTINKIFLYMKGKV